MIFTVSTCRDKACGALMYLLLMSGLALVVGCSAFNGGNSVGDPLQPRLLEIHAEPSRQTWLDLQNKISLAPYLNDLLNDPSHLALHPVDVNADLVKGETSRIFVPLPRGKLVEFKLRWSSEIRKGKTYWYGDQPSARRQHFPAAQEVDVDPVNWIALVRYDDKVYGEIHLDGQMYRLDYVGVGRQVLVQVDPSKKGALTCEAVEDTAPPAASALKQRKPAHSGTSVIRVMMMSTAEARAGFSRRPADGPSLSDVMQDHLIFANLAFVYSGVDIQYEFAGYVESLLSEKDKTAAEVLRLTRMPGSDVYEQMQAARERYRADLVLTAVFDPSVLGRYYADSRKETAFSTWQVAGDYLDMAHVLGRNMGASHYWKPGDPEFDPPYQHGYVIPGTHARTIMADYESCPSCTGLSYYSNPKLQWQGVPMGTPGRYDVVRRLNERRTEVEAFYP